MRSDPASPPAGFRYYISDEQLAVFAGLSTMQRLEWVEAAREFSWLAQTAETRLRQQRLREGKPIA